MLRFLPQMLMLVEGTPVLEHNLLRNNVVDGDNYIIHVQVRGDEAKEGGGSGKAGEH